MAKYVSLCVPANDHCTVWVRVSQVPTALMNFSIQPCGKESYSIWTLHTSVCCLESTLHFLSPKVTFWGEIEFAFTVCPKQQTGEDLSQGWINSKRLVQAEDGSVTAKSEWAGKWRQMRLYVPLWVCVCPRPSDLCPSISLNTASQDGLLLPVTYSYYLRTAFLRI